LMPERVEMRRREEGRVTAGSGAVAVRVAQSTC